jgi:chromosome segregation ATPase
MSASLTDLADNLKAYLNGHRALTQLSAFMDEQVSLEQLAREAQERAAKATANASAAEASLAGIQGTLDATTQRITAARAQAVTIVSEAEDEATDIRAQAAADAAQAISIAEQTASRIAGDTEQAQGTLDALTQQVAIKRGELADVQQQLAEIKRNAASLAR